MTKSQFRALLMLSLVGGLAGGLLDLVFPSLITEALRQAQEAHDAELSLARLLVAMAFALPGLALALMATYGLYKFRHWGPRLGLLGTAVALLSVPVFGAGVQSGLAGAISYAASYLWGASLVLAHVSPYNAWFVRPTARSEA